MRAWLFELLVCPGCGGRLAALPGVPLVVCRRCAARFPVLDDAPVVVPSPPDYLAGYRDAALATLAARGRATRRAVEVVEAFANAGARTEPLAFGDDWVSGEADAELAPPVPAGGDDSFGRFLAASHGAIDDAIVAALPPGGARTLVELGAGAGVLARRLATTAGVARLLVADLSLRAALRAADHARGRRGRRAEVGAAVLDAEALPLAPRAVDAIVAAELIDLLTAPADFLHGAAGALRTRGRLILATPDPALGGDDPDRLRDLLRRQRWRIISEQRAVPWVRPHGPRHYQVYFADVLAAAPPR